MKREILKSTTRKHMPPVPKSEHIVEEDQKVLKSAQENIKKIPNKIDDMYFYPLTKPRKSMFKPTQVKLKDTVCNSYCIDCQGKGKINTFNSLLSHLKTKNHSDFLNTGSVIIRPECLSNEVPSITADSIYIIGLNGAGVLAHPEMLISIAEEEPAAIIIVEALSGSQELVTDHLPERVLELFPNVFISPKSSDKRSKGAVILTRRNFPASRGHDLGIENLVSATIQLNTKEKIALVGAYIKPNEFSKEEVCQSNFRNQRELQFSNFDKLIGSLKSIENLNSVIGFVDANMDRKELVNFQKANPNLEQLNFLTTREIPDIIEEMIGTHYNKKNCKFSTIDFPFCTSNVTPSQVFIRPFPENVGFPVSDHMPVHTFFKINRRSVYVCDHKLIKLKGVFPIPKDESFHLLSYSQNLDNYNFLQCNGKSKLRHLNEIDKEEDEVDVNNVLNILGYHKCNFDSIEKIPLHDLFKVDVEKLSKINFNKVCSQLIDLLNILAKSQAYHLNCLTSILINLLNLKPDYISKSVIIKFLDTISLKFEGDKTNLLQICQIFMTETFWKLIFENFNKIEGQINFNLLSKFVNEKNFKFLDFNILLKNKNNNSISQEALNIFISELTKIGESEKDVLIPQENLKNAKKRIQEWNIPYNSSSNSLQNNSEILSSDKDDDFYENISAYFQNLPENCDINDIRNLLLEYNVNCLQVVQNLLYSQNKEKLRKLIILTNGSKEGAKKFKELFDTHEYKGKKVIFTWL